MSAGDDTGLLIAAGLGILVLSGSASAPQPPTKPVSKTRKPSPAKKPIASAPKGPSPELALARAETAKATADLAKAQGQADALKAVAAARASEAKAKVDAANRAAAAAQAQTDATKAEAANAILQRRLTEAEQAKANATKALEEAKKANDKKLKTKAKARDYIGRTVNAATDKGAAASIVYENAAKAKEQEKTAVLQVIKAEADKRKVEAQAAEGKHKDLVVAAAHARKKAQDAPDPLRVPLEIAATSKEAAELDQRKEVEQAKLKAEAADKLKNKVENELKPQDAAAGLVRYLQDPTSNWGTKASPSAPVRRGQKLMGMARGDQDGIVGPRTRKRVKALGSTVPPASKRRNGSLTPSRPKPLSTTPPIERTSGQGRWSDAQRSSAVDKMALILMDYHPPLACPSITQDAWTDAAADINKRGDMVAACMAAGVPLDALLSQPVTVS